MGTHDKSSRIQREAELARLRNIVACERDNKEVHVALAGALYDEISNGDDKYFDELRALVEHNENEADDLVPFLGKALYSSMFIAAEEGEEELATKRLDELRRLIARFSHLPDVRYAFGMAMSYLHDGADEIGRQRLRSELTSLAVRYPDDAELQHWLTTLL